MVLTHYKKKRSFKNTPEPTGGKAAGPALRFVVQKHAATRLHYDFRLEMEGVLKSWAVPKGPSLNPEDKRLAMMVEDHPYDYRTFEGIIPKGNYGAGTVIVWDEGTYEALEPGSKSQQEKLLLQQLKKGSLKFRLSGSKLKGEFALVKLKNSEDNAWLLIKHRDKYAKEIDITKKDKSVVSEKTIEQIAKTSKSIWGSSPKKKNKTPSPEKSPEKKKQKSEGEKAPFPKTVRPMLATLVDKPFDEPGWLYEIKWDGYRAVAMMNKGKINLISRNNKSFNDKFYPVYDALKKWGINAIVDGEVTVLNEKGMSHFGSLQNWRSEADGELFYYVFDIIWLNGYSLKELPLTKRREILKELVPAEGIIRMSENFETSATEFLKVASEMGMEGIMAKKEDSIYIEGDRTREWLKIKSNKRHEVVIGGFTQNEGSSKTFSSLLVGVFDNGRLDYIGKIGTGFNDKTQKEIMTKMKKLATDKPPFTETPDVDKPSRFRPNPPKAKVTWLKPELVCEVSYAEITSDGVMRHPSFEGLRIDKKAKDVKKDIEVPAKEIIKSKSEKRKKSPPASSRAGNSEKNQYTKPVKDTGRKTLLNPTEETQVRKINRHELKFTNLSKVFWPKEKYTKRDMLNYYYQVAPYLLPYLKDRPQSLNRYPNGINGKSFYQKDITNKVPGWIKMEPYTTSEGDNKNFLVPEDEASILYMANAGAIEMNPWNSTIHKEDYPDWCLIDLDPSDKNSFDDVIKVAQVTKEVLDNLGVPGYAKTSGSTGIHVYIPLGAKYTYDQCQLFGRIIATQVHHILPDLTSIERLTRERKNKLYVDFLQNRPKATLAAPYSLRPKPGATVSMPLYWKEIKKGLTMKDFTIKNAMERIKSEGDIFKPVLGKGIDLEKVLENI